MTRSLVFTLRLSVIAAAAAMLMLCVRAAQAQDDRYGFVPVPPPTMAVPSPMATPTPAYAPGFTPAPAGPIQTSPGFIAANDGRYAVPLGSPTPPGYQPAYQSASRGGFNGAYQLGPGDKIHVSVFGEDDLTGDYVIDGSGMVRLPLIGTLPAAGATAPALEANIAGMLAQGYLKNPRVNVDIATYRPFYILGAVGRPGEYPYVDNMTALNAVALGGGFTDQARQSTVWVRHEGEATEHEVPATQLTRIYPGDVVRVKTTTFWDVMAVFSPLAGPAALAAAAVK